MADAGWHGPGHCPALIGQFACNGDVIPLGPGPEKIPGDPLSGLCEVHLRIALEEALAKAVFEGKLRIDGTDENGRTMYRAVDEDA